ncbi:MAG: methyltransferase, partial [Flaviaesturariibacter sp.]|nr:methyltransferase [Flaviaesturariibacter sp.]
RQARIEAVLAQRQTGLTVVLENVFDPHNVSAVLRSCDAVGIQEVFVVNTRAPRLERWGFRSSGSAYKWLMVHQFDRIDTCVDAVRQRYDAILTTHLGANAVGLYETDLTKRTALVFGNEASGVSDELNDRADGNFIIPQVGMIKSLNISVACAVSVYEAYRQKKAAGHYDQPQLDERDAAEIAIKWGLTNEAV